MMSLTFKRLRPTGWTVEGASPAQHLVFTELSATRRADFGLALDSLYSVNLSDEVDQAGVRARIEALAPHDDLASLKERYFLSELLELFDNASQLRRLHAASGTWDVSGTRYQLVFTQDPNGGVLVSWPEGGLVFRANFDTESGALGLVRQRHHSYTSRVDVDAIGRIVTSLGPELAAWGKP